MNDDIYLRKDLADERYKSLFDMITAANHRIDDLHTTLNHVLAVVGICVASLAIIVPLVLYFLQQSISH